MAGSGLSVCEMFVRDQFPGNDVEGGTLLVNLREALRTLSEGERQCAGLPEVGASFRETVRVTLFSRGRSLWLF